MKKSIQLSKEDLSRFRARLIRKVWRDMYDLFEKRSKEEGLTKKDIADLLGVHRSIITKRLNGTSNVSLEIISDMSRALNALPSVKLCPFEEIEQETNQTYLYQRTQCFYLSPDLKEDTEYFDVFTSIDHRENYDEQKNPN